MSSVAFCFQTQVKWTRLGFIICQRSRSDENTLNYPHKASVMLSLWSRLIPRLQNFQSFTTACCSNLLSYLSTNTNKNAFGTKVKYVTEESLAVATPPADYEIKILRALWLDKLWVIRGLWHNLPFSHHPEISFPKLERENTTWKNVTVIGRGPNPA